MSRTHNELSEVLVTVKPKDAARKPTTPTTASYRIDDCLSGRELVAWTVLTPAETMTITVPASVNAIIDSTRSTPEEKVVSLEFDKGLLTQHTAEYFYRIRNLRFAQVT